MPCHIVALAPANNIWLIQKYHAQSKRLQRIVEIPEPNQASGVDGNLYVVSKKTKKNLRKLDHFFGVILRKNRAFRPKIHSGHCCSLEKRSKTNAFR